jgi:adenylylsulfate kinase-like enzyme
VARLLADAGAIVIVSLISPYAADRARARAIHEASELEFLEVFVDTPVEECERRDPKGLYERARRGEIQDFTGVQAPYEAPQAPAVRLCTSDTTLANATERVQALLAERGILER